MRVLDEVADAIRIARGGRTSPVLSAIDLETILGGPISPRQWTPFEDHLNCPFPPLDFDQGHWFRTDEFRTVWDLVDHVAAYHPEWELPAERTVAAWGNAQIFAGVRAELAYAGNLDPRDVVREARLGPDLGMA